MMYHQNTALINLHYIQAPFIPLMKIIIMDDVIHNNIAHVMIFMFEICWTILRKYGLSIAAGFMLFYSCYIFRLLRKAIIRQFKKYTVKDNLNTAVRMILLQITLISTLQK